MGFTVVYFVLALVMAGAVLSLWLLWIGFIWRKAVEDGMPIQRPGETEEEWTARLREQIESDRAQTTAPGE